MAGPEDSKNVKSTETRGREEKDGNVAIEALGNAILEQSELLVEKGKLLAEQGEQIEALGERIDDLEAGMDKIPELIAKQGAGVLRLPKRLSGIIPVKHPVTRKWVSPEVAKKAQLELDKEKKRKKSD
jgi:hypothetical protein